jgi:predicted nucleic acid-binding protein
VGKFSSDKCARESKDAGGVLPAREERPGPPHSGYTVRQTIDCLIATFCLEARHALLHRDHDFDPFEKILPLQVVHP